MARLDSFLRLVVEQHASDLHLHAGSVPLIRHDGELIALPFRELSDDEARRLLFEVMSEEHRTTFEHEGEVDFAVNLEGVGRFRTNVFRQRCGVGAVFRIIPNQPPLLAELGFPPSVRKLVELSNGMVLITGPTGSGKTTTLAAMVHEINSTEQRHVITIEDPIEFIHEPLKSVVTQRQVGLHVDSFANALRSALREAPDVIVVGEMRDLETMSLALSAAETSVLVLATMHTNSAAKAVSRIVDAFPEESRDQIRSIVSVLLRGVVAQTLCRRAEGEGRIAAVEVLLHSYGIANLIRENKVYQIESYLQSVEHAGTGMQSLDTCLARYVRQGLISADEAMRFASMPDVIRQAAAALAEDA